MKAQGRGRVFHRAPVTGPYVPVASRDWSALPSKASLDGVIGVEAGLNGSSPTCVNKDPATGIGLCDPILPTSDFYDLVTDPIFGKAVRYLGGPQLNTVLATRPGRTAVHRAPFLPLSNCWTRQYVKFSPNYSTQSTTGGQGAASHKLMFQRFEMSSQRHAWIVEGRRGMTHETGEQQGQTVVDNGTLPWENAISMNQQYGGSGYGSPDAWPMIGSDGGVPAAAPKGLGDNEWYEVILHHKAINERGEHTLAWRRYTLNGVVNPGPWTIRAKWHQFAPGQVWKKVNSYEMGVNRNRQWDEPMYIDWGPYAVVDGSKYPNPFAAPWV